MVDSRKGRKKDGQLRGSINGTLLVVQFADANLILATDVNVSRYYQGSVVQVVRGSQGQNADFNRNTSDQIRLLGANPVCDLLRGAGYGRGRYIFLEHPQVRC